MATQATSKLLIVDDIPAVAKLWNGRYRLEFFCQPSDKKTGWYKANIDKWLPAFGALQDDALENGWEYPANQGVSYDDMRLVEASVPYVPSAGEHFIRLVYETLTSSWVQEKDDTTDYDLNGLKRVSRQYVALPDATYDSVVGTTTIDSNGTTVYLAKYQIDETDAKWTLTEEWYEHGELSRNEDLEDGKGAITITNLGDCPTAPDGYTAVKTSEDNTQGLPTCTVTFYKDDSELSRSNDYVGSQLAEMVEVFNPTTQPTPTNLSAVLGSKVVSNVDGIPTTRYTFLVPSVLSQSEDLVGSQKAITIEAFDEIPPTPTEYALANTQKSEIEGIPTVRYTFLKPSVLSESEDRVGSQKAIAIEAFNETPSTPSGYVLAKEDISDVEGIPTKRYTFLKPSILSESEDLVGSQKAKVIETFSETPSTPDGYELARTDISDFEGIKTNRYTFLNPSILRVRTLRVGGNQAVTVSAFSLSESAASTAVSEVTSDHLLIESSVDDVDGIETSTFTYEVGEFEVFTTDESGLPKSTLIELSSSDFATAGTIGATLRGNRYLSSETIDNGGLIKKRVTEWMEAGILSRSLNNLSEGVQEVTTTFLVAEIEEEVVGPVVRRVTSNFNGLKTIAVSTLQDGEGGSVVGDGTKTVATYQQLYPFTYPGVLSISERDLSGNGDTYSFTAMDFELDPPSQCKITANTIIRFSTKSLVDSQYPIWSPKSWAKGYARGIGWNYAPFAVDKGFRGYRVEDEIVLSGVEDGAVDSEWNMVLGNRIYNGTPWEIGISGGPIDPTGATFTLDYKITQAFQDVDGVPYYRHVMTYATIPQKS